METKETIVSQLLNFMHSYKDSYELSLSINASYNNLYYSDLSLEDRQYLTGSFLFTGNINLTQGLILATNINYNWATGRMNGYKANNFILNGSISKSFFSKKQFIISLKGFDLLKNNISVTRKIEDNYIEDTRSVVLERFFLLTASYYLGKRK